MATDTALLSPITITQALQRAPLYGVSRSEASLLLAYCGGYSATALITHAHAHLAPVVIQHYEKCLQQRSDGLPIAYIIGTREFFGYSFKVDARVLIPRPETELLVELAITQLPSGAKLLDMGCGSGAIAISIALQRRDVVVVASDKSAEALALAQANAQHLGARITFIQSDWWQGIEGHFDAVVSNPPYIAADDIHLSQGDCRFEPHHALVGGKAGNEAIISIVLGAQSHCKKIYIEHGYDQASWLRNYMTQQGLHTITSINDLAGITRVTYGTFP